MVGRLRNEQLLVSGRGTAPAFKGLVQDADNGTKLVLKSSGEGGYGPSDHISFALKKIPVLFFWTGIHADYHQPSDDADKINYAGMDEVIDFGEKVVDRVVAMPRQAYNADADKNSDPHGGAFAGEPPRVTLGVVPDYNAEESVLGVKIAGSRADTPAAKAGLIEGDVIIKLGDRNIDSLYALTDALAVAEPDKPTTVTVLRNGEKLELPVTLVKRKPQ
jgi:C-terminal processing protease CtpA/Prc